MEHLNEKQFISIWTVIIIETIKNNPSLECDKIFIDTFPLSFNIAYMEIARDELSQEKINL